MKPYLILLLAVVCAVRIQAAQAAGELSNDKVRLVVDDQGRLVELANRQTGHRYVVNSGRPVWRMFYRTPDALELEIPAESQKAQVRREGDTLTISYASLQGNTPLEGQTRNLKVVFSLRAVLSGDGVEWTARIENRDEPGVEITELWIPLISGIGDLGLGHAADVLYWPESGGRRIQDPYARLTAAPGQQFGFRRGDTGYQMTYPWPASMQWFALNNGEEGIYFASYDRSLMTTCLSVTARRDAGLSASIVKYPFAKAGETWTSAPTVMRLFRGDWHRAAKMYRAWTDTWLGKPNPAKWLRGINGWIIPNLKAQNGSRFNGVYGDLPTMYKNAKAVGIDVVSIYGWVRQGFDNLYPEYDPDPAMGGEQGLKDAVAQIRQGGGYPLLYSQGQLIDPASQFYRTKGRTMTAKDIWGYEYRETYGGGGRGTLLNIMRNKLFGVACPLAPGWYEQLVSQVDMAQHYGVKGMMFDQLGGRPPYICYSNEHRHTKPSLANGPGKVEIMSKLRDLIKSRDPEFAFVIELVVDCYTPYADIIHSHGYGYSYGAPYRAETFGEMFRYTFPEPIITNRPEGTPDRTTQFGYGFSLGWRTDAMTRDTTDPVAGPYIARLNQFRAAYPELLLNGRFVDNEGFLCDNSAVTAHAMVAGDRLAVTLWNPSETPQKARVEAPGYTLEDTKWMNPAWSGPDHSLLPKDAAVLVFRRANR